MISPELLRRYPFFGFMEDNELKAVAMIAEEKNIEKGAVILKADDPANILYFLEEGSASNYFIVEDLYNNRKELFIDSINPGEIFGFSALLEPYKYTATVRAEKDSRVIKIDGSALRALCQFDPHLSCGLLEATAKVIMQRLHDTRILLAAATVKV